MSKIDREDIGNLHASLVVTLSADDYMPKVNSELNKYRKKAQMKGFRKGKTPMGMIKKMYGKSVMGEVVNEMLQNEMFQYIKDEKIDILGQPIPAENQEQLNLELGNKEDLVFRFEVGIAPAFELKGLDNDNKFSQYSVEVPDEMIDKDLEVARTRSGERQQVESDIVEGDMVKLNIEELDGDGLKENGWASTFSVVVEERLFEEFKTEITGKKVGDKFSIDINKIEKDRDEDFIHKYFLNVEEADDDVEIGANFEAIVEEISRVLPAELNQEFYDKSFGEGKVNSEEEARAFIAKDILKFYDRQAESLLFRDFQDNLLEQNAMELPDVFLKRWLKVANDLSEEAVENDFENFTKNLQWSLLRSKMVEKFGIEIKEEEVLEGFKERIRGYFGGYGDELIVLNTANRLMEDKNQVDQLHQELMADKLYIELKNVVSVDAQKISMEEFEKVVKQAQEELQNRQNPSGIEDAEVIEEDIEESTEEVADVE